MVNIRLYAVLAALFFLICPVSIQAQEIVKLPAPKTDGGMPLMQALKERKSSREFSKDKLSLPTLSNLLWAAWGINRLDGHHTAPSASIGRRSMSMLLLQMVCICMKPRVIS